MTLHEDPQSSRLASDGPRDLLGLMSSPYVEPPQVNTKHRLSRIAAFQDSKTGFESEGVLCINRKLLSIDISHRLVHKTYSSYCRNYRHIKIE